MCIVLACGRMGTKLLLEPSDIALTASSAPERCCCCSLCSRQQASASDGLLLRLSLRAQR